MDTDEPEGAHRSAARGGLWAVLALLMLAVSCYVGYRLGLELSGYRHVRAERELERSARRLKKLEADNARLLVNGAQLERTAQIDEEAAARVKRELNRLEARVAALNKELTFYKNIVSPPDKARGLSLQAALRPGEGPREFAYELVLAHRRGDLAAVRGEVQVHIAGQQGGESRRLSLAQLGDDAKLKFSFRYFQSLKGRLVLPAGFEPRRVHIHVQPRSSAIKVIDRELTWSEMLQAGDLAEGREPGFAGANS